MEQKEISMCVKFRGETFMGKKIEGSLVITDRYIKNKPAQWTKYWIIEHSFGNGGWFNVIMKKPVKKETIEIYLFDMWMRLDQIEAVTLTLKRE